MINKENIKSTVFSGVIIAAIVILGQFGVAKLLNHSGSSVASFGAVGNLKIEDYDPYVRSNGGINTALGITNSGVLTQSGATAFTSTVTVGSTGTAFSTLAGRQCYIRPYATTVPASGTATVDCQATPGWNAAGTDGTTALSGVTAVSNIVAGLSTTTAFNLASTSATFLVNAPLDIVGVSGSSTSGFITLQVQNASTSPYVWPVGKNASGSAFFFSSN